jgi:hypothetical protein
LAEQPASKPGRRSAAPAVIHPESESYEPHA